MVDEMAQAREAMGRSLLACRDDNDVLARAEFAKTKICADLLEQITDMANVTGDGGPENAFQATQAVEAYELFAERYGR